MNPKIMLLDEPTSALDPELVKDVLDAVAALVQAGMTMVIVTHQMLFAQHVADRAVFMDEGQVVEIATPSELVAHPQQERTRKFMSRILYGAPAAQDAGIAKVRDG
jgi:ABC-type polar amino acid transport system ATPase subunit